MRKRTKKIILFSNFVLIGAFTAVLFLFVYFSATEPLTGKLMTDKPVKFLLTFYGTQQLHPGAIECYFVFFERETKLLKVLSINTEAVVFRKKTRARPLSHSFFSAVKNDLNLALANFHKDVFEMTGNSFVPDYYINASFEDLEKIMSRCFRLKKAAGNKDFENRDLQCLNRLELAEALLETFRQNTFASIRGIRKNYNLLDTNISKLAFANMIMYFRIYDAGIIYFDLPVKYAHSRVEPDKDNISDLLYTVYYPLSDTEMKNLEGFIDVRNASGKPRMAEKAAWKLRENKFDVLEWGNFKTSYDKTVIKNYKGGYGAVKKIVSVLGCGKVINSYNGKSALHACVFIGKDCEIYDKFDKKTKEDVNGKN